MGYKCPICTGHCDHLLQLDRYAVWHCHDCSHRFCPIELRPDHVAQEFGDSYFKGGGTSGYPDYLASAKLLRAYGARYAERIEPFLDAETRAQPTKQLIDIGCAGGLIMQGFESAGWQVNGIDPNRTMVDHARGLGLNACQGTLESLSEHTELQVPEHGFDLVLMVQVIAHLHDLPRALGELSKLVRPGGYLLVETWDSCSRTARLLGRHWHEYSPPNVLHYFTRSSLDVLMWQAGFRQRATGRPGKKISVAHAQSLVDYKYGDQPIGRAMLQMSRLLPESLAIPYPSEDLFWGLYRRD